MSTSTAERSTHHHGNLRAALIVAGIEMLESGEDFSLRAVARKVGVSQAAPYRHFSSKRDIEAAMAVHGFRELQGELEAVIAGRPDSHTPMVELAIAYIHFAQAHPALYSLMFGQTYSDDEERQTACSNVFSLIQDAAAQTHPSRSAHGLATAGWALAHGLATLHLERVLGSTDEDFDARVHEAFAALLD